MYNNLKNFFNTEKTQKYLNIFVFIFLVVQPIFDLKIFYNSISSLIRVIIIGMLFLLYFFISSNKKKYWLILYPLIILIYFVFHHINAMTFTSLVPNNFNYSVLSEFLYFIKMLTPFFLIYVLYKSNIKSEKIIKIINYIVIIIGTIIIVSNIFVFSYGSYSDQKIKANFFSWFTNNDFTYQDLASKGLFEYANQIGAILLMFLPFSLFSFLNNKKLNNFVTLIINTLALFLLGTKVAVLGVVLVFIYTNFIYIFYKKLILKHPLDIKPFIVICSIFICYLLIIFNNPIFMRINETKTIATSSETIINETQENTYLNENSTSNIANNLSENTDDLITFIEQNYKDKQIKEEFITKSYPYKYDPEFWLAMFNEPLYNRVNYRFVEQSMIKRVFEINNNKYDKYFGITNARLQNIFNIERDFVVQYYALGIIGTILILFNYLILLVFYIYKVLKSKLKYLTIINLLAFISIIMAFGISYFSGNLLNSLSFTLYLALLYCLLLKES